MGRSITVQLVAGRLRAKGCPFKPQLHVARTGPVLRYEDSK